jgi:thiol-disulfide isomerase/thioredoxin
MSPRSLVLFFAAVSVASAAVKVGDAFPPLTTPGVAGLAGAKVPDTAGKIVLVDFWASWCAPCKASFPMMAKLHADYAARGVAIVAVGIDEKPTAAEGFIKKLAPPFPALHDRQQKLVRQVAVPAMPTSYLLGPDGRVRFIHQGFHGDATEREIRRHLDALLAEKP